MQQNLINNSHDKIVTIAALPNNVCAHVTSRQLRLKAQNQVLTARLIPCSAARRLAKGEAMILPPEGRTGAGAIGVEAGGGGVGTGATGVGGVGRGLVSAAGGGGAAASGVEEAGAADG